MINRLIDIAAQHQREQPTLDAYPITREESVVFDYASPAQAIQMGMRHLDEGLPGGQRQRCSAAYKAMIQGVLELGVWMRMKGYDV